MKLEKHFLQKCKEVLNAGRKAGKESCFWLLGYITLFALRNKAVDETVRRRRTEEMKVVQANLLKLDC